MTLIYKVPATITRPFRRGDLVEVCDRDLVAMSTQRVVYVGKRIVRLDCRRRFRSSDGWWVGENGIWPFPSIRHQKKGGVS